MLGYRNNPQDPQSGGLTPADCARFDERGERARRALVVRAENMSAAVARDVYQTIALWRQSGLLPIDAWHALGAPRSSHVSWSKVEDFMVDWLMRHARVRGSGLRERRMR